MTLVLRTCTCLLFCITEFVEVEVDVEVEKAENTGREMIGECSLSHPSMHYTMIYSNPVIVR